VPLENNSNNTTTTNVKETFPHRKNRSIDGWVGALASFLDGKAKRNFAK
jgi:hypothetical protein